MNRLMNLMKQMKLKRGAGGVTKKNRAIFFREGCGALILGSQRFICFINWLIWWSWMAIRGYCR